MSNSHIGLPEDFTGQRLTVRAKNALLNFYGCGNRWEDMRGMAASAVYRRLVSEVSNCGKLTAKEIVEVAIEVGALVDDFHLVDPAAKLTQEEISWCRQNVHRIRGMMGNEPLKGGH